MGKIDRAVEELSQFLDTFYTDVEGWLELADIYASCNQYAIQSQFSTSSLTLLVTRGLVDTISPYSLSRMSSC